MAKIKNVYQQICGINNLYSAAHNTLKRGRRFTADGAEFKFNLEANIEKIRYELIGMKYKPGKYRKFSIKDPKPREVLVAPFKDRVVHHAICDVIEPIIDKQFIHDSYACRTGKGTHAGIKRAQGFLNSRSYVIHLDIVKFFFNINHEILKSILPRYIADDKLLTILNRIIDSTSDNPEPSNSGMLDIFAKTSFGNKGLPIGNLTSQLFANIYLNELDQFAKHELKLKKYIRYMDDFLVFDDDTKRLNDVEGELIEFCNNKLALEVHPSGGPVKYTKGFTFLGWRIFRNHLRLKPENIRRFVSRTCIFEKELQSGEKTFNEFKQSLLTWNSYARFGDTYNLRTHLYKSLPITQEVFYIEN